MAENAAGKAQDWLQESVDHAPQWNSEIFVNDTVERFQRHLGNQGVSIEEQQDLIIDLAVITKATY